jgi:superfamily I DNA and/or RNA helicase
MLHYYLNLPKDSPLDVEKNQEVSKGMFYSADKSFKPFETYLRNVIKTLEEKEAIKAKWKKVKVDNLAWLAIIGGLYEFVKRTEIKVSIEQKGSYRIILKSGKPDFDEKLIYQIGDEKTKILVSEEDYQTGIIKLGIETQKFGKITWGGEDVELIPAWTEFKANEILTGNNSDYTILSIDNDIWTVEGDLSSDEKIFYQDMEIAYTIKQKNNRPNGTIIREDKRRIIIYSEEKITGLDKIKEKDIGSFITNHKLVFENGNELDAEHEENVLFLLKNADDYGKVVTANSIKFRIEPLQKNNKEAFRIQLIDIDDNDNNDDIQTLSPLRHFFNDDNISVFVEETKKRYDIIVGRESDQTLILNDKEEKKFDFPLPEGSTLTVKVNTSSLKKQLDAIATLKNMPTPDHAPLIKLFENVKNKNVQWCSPDNKSVNEWYVITDINRSGYEKQREFVNKALNTKDFAILEGPPGSGKTTAILELICQLIKQGKRVLLCGSTHVAIDNILERLKEKSFLEKFHILPVRIGDNWKISDDIIEFKIDNLIKDNGIAEELLLSSANLVCGTTMGIPRHPNFEKRNNFVDHDGKKMKRAWIEPIIPEFDCLIIDECSKTTFQEFLVPALYAKKWILAGDVMQLSPFTERENIVSNLKHLVVDGKPLPQDLQFAVFYLHKLKECVRNGNNRFVLPVSEEIIEQMCLELDKGRIEDFKDKIILFITAGKLQSENSKIMIKNIGDINFLEAAVADIIFVEETSLQNILPYLSERHAVLRGSAWEKSEHAFIHNEYQKRRNFNNSFEIVKNINEYFIKKKEWAEEIAWRIDREHQTWLITRKEKKRGKSYTEQIKELLPKAIDSEKIETEINSIAEMAFPSILESLVQGIKGRKTKVESTISEGFKPDDLAKRKTTLVYQHRMHPEISKFPREQFYKDADALKDLEKPVPIEELRQWEYGYYPSRSIWVNVDGETNRNYNLEERDVLIEHLKTFVNWAKDNKPPEENAEEWTAACLTFYRPQERHLREKLQALCKKENGRSNFTYKEGKYPVKINLHTVDKFQGHEADIVFLSMVRTKRVGFMDNPNRLNVAVTRAKFQLVVFGKRACFLNQDDSDDLKEMANKMPLYTKG